eukprot:10061633-Ditylum_brightwellii.AAC.1
MRNASLLVWDHRKAQVTFQHSASYLPEMTINTVWHAHCSANLNLATNGFVKEADFEHSQYATNDDNSDKEREFAQMREQYITKHQLDDNKIFIDNNQWA